MSTASFSGTRKIIVFLFVGLLLGINFCGIYAEQPSGPITTGMEVTGNETWTGEIQIQGDGFIKLNGNLKFENATISLKNLSDISTLLYTDNGSSLTFINSTIDLTGLGKVGFIWMENGIISLDHSEIKGADRASLNESISSVIRAVNCDVQITGSKIYNNKTGLSNLFNISGGTLTITGSEITGNEAFLRWEDPYDTIYPFFWISNADTVISNTKIQNNKLAILYLLNVDSALFDHIEFTDNRTQDSDDESFSKDLYSIGLIPVNQTKLKIDNSVFKNNDDPGPIFVGTGSEITVGNVQFVNNHNYPEPTEYRSSIFSMTKTKLNISSDAAFQENSGTAIMMTSGEIKIDDGAKFSRHNNGVIRLLKYINEARPRLEIGKAVFTENEWNSEYDGVGGIIFGYKSDIILNGTEFSGNKALNGGVLKLTDGSTLELNNQTHFTGNQASADGGVIYANNNSDEELKIVINDAIFENNKAVNGGALMLDGDKSAKVNINKGIFINNTAEKEGAAIYISENASVFSGDTAVVENTGGGIRAEAGSKTNLRPENGAAVFDNTSADAPEGFQDLYVSDDRGELICSEKMFNGGAHNWKQQSDGGAGTFWGADPTNKDITSAAVLIQNNTISSTVPHSPDEGSGSDSFGGAISNYGILDIGRGNEPVEEPENQITFFRLNPLERLPKTGFSASSTEILAEKPKDLSYLPLRMILEIPSQSIMAEIVKVPYLDADYPVDWLGNQVGLLEGTSLPGEGRTVITGHNHLNNFEIGPFALLKNVSLGDLIFVVDKTNQIKIFRIYANESISENNIMKMEEIASKYENSLTLLTCEDESTNGVYLNRRVVAAKPVQ